jgi:hypothetical protein
LSVVRDQGARLVFSDNRARRQRAARSGTIVCGAVSKSAAYKDRLQKLDRKILAIDTESGGIFEEASANRLPAGTIRGISDYADNRKTDLEDTTGGIIRQIAASNAASFLKLQIANPRFVQIIAQHRTHEQDGASIFVAPSMEPKSVDVMDVITQLGHQIALKLRELCPEFRLQPKGYRLPVARVRPINYSAGIKHLKLPTRYSSGTKYHRAKGLPRFRTKSRHQFVLLWLGKIMKRQTSQRPFIRPNGATSQNRWRLPGEERQRTHLGDQNPGRSGCNEDDRRAWCCRGQLLGEGTTHAVSDDDGRRGQRGSCLV